MYFHQKKFIKKALSSTCLPIASFCALSAFEVSTIPSQVLSAPSMMEFRWDQDSNYRKLYYTQSSEDKTARSTYYLVMKPKDRKTAILKLSIKVPDYFDSKLTPKKFSLCKIQIGGFKRRTKCKEKIPAVIEVNNKETTIDIFPNDPIPADKEGYAVVMKIFNPTKVGMYQFNAMTQSPGELPISSYIGSWSIDIR